MMKENAIDAQENEEKRQKNVSGAFINKYFNPKRNSFDILIYIPLSSFFLSPFSFHIFSIPF